MTATEIKYYQKQLLFHFAEHVKMTLFHFFGYVDFSKGKKIFIYYMHTSWEKITEKHQKESDGHFYRLYNKDKFL